MAGAMKKVHKIRQIIQLRQIMQRWKALSLRKLTDADSASASSSRRIPAGFLAVYVGAERRRFVIPTRYLNMPVFSSLLKMAEEEFGVRAPGGLAFPCEVDFFRDLLRILEEDEQRFRRADLDEVLKLFAETSLDSCKESSAAAVQAFTPLLPKARV